MSENILQNKNFHAYCSKVLHWAKIDFELTVAKYRVTKLKQFLKVEKENVKQVPNLTATEIIEVITQKANAETDKQLQDMEQSLQKQKELETKLLQELDDIRKNAMQQMLQTLQKR